MTTEQRERRTLTYGKEIFARVDRQGPIAFTPAWFDDRLMNWTMNHPQLKVQLFRFVEALPRLHDPAAIAQHLREYLGQAGSALPWWIRFAINLIPSRGIGGRSLAWAAKTSAEHLAKRFIVGSNVPEALASIQRLREQKLAFTIDLLGEATITEVEADAVERQYIDLLHGLQSVHDWAEIPLIDRDSLGPIPRVNVSVKLSALFSQFDPIDRDGTTRVVCSRLRTILRLARKTKAMVNVDMEQYAFKDTTLHIFKTILMEPEFRDWSDVGIAIQAYLKDTEADLQDLLSWVQKRGTRVWIRLVKGAYWDYETVIAAQNDWPIPVWTQKHHSDACFERCGRFLLTHHQYLRPAFGTHNVRSMAAMMAIAEELRLPPNAYEFQMLYGMGDEYKQVLVAMNQRVRIYTPFGQLLPGMAYLVRRLLENTSNESFLRASSSGDTTEERLLMNPAAIPDHYTRTTKSVPFHNEPLTDFSRLENQQKMLAGLDRVRYFFGRTYPLIINDRPVMMTHTIDSLNPSNTKEIVGRSCRATTKQAVEAIQAAKNAFDSWRDLSSETRANYLKKTARIMRERRFELAAWMVYESGKPWREADADVAEAIDFCEYYALEMQRLAQPHTRNVPGEDNQLVYDGRGVVIVIAPWNFPLAILCGMTVAALVTGNTVIMKPAEQTPIIAAKLMDVFQQAGFPRGVVNYLPGVGEEIGPTLVEHPDVALIAFTGSVGVGLSIKQQAAITLTDRQHHVKKVIAEMGGKNAIIIDADADLDEAVKAVVESAFGFAGQKCSAGSRAIVLEPIYDAFVTRLVEAVKSMTICPADLPGCSMGPVIDEEARQRIIKMIELGQQEATLAYAGDIGELAAHGTFVAPHVFIDVNPNSAIAQQEIFGPVLAVMKAADLGHALTIANSTRYALTGGFFSRSPNNIARVKRAFRVGNLYVNRKITGALVDRQPFGGFKLSGIGSKAGGPDYLLQFVLPRVITENTMRRGFAPETE